jgi:hypothetical protein
LRLGRPLARLFFDPQNTMVISSARKKPSHRLAKVRIIITAASSAASASTRRTSWGRECDERGRVVVSVRWGDVV